MTAWVKQVKEDDLASVRMMPQGKWKRYNAQIGNEPLVGIFFKV
jgi:hypothetical protein